MKQVGFFFLLAATLQSLCCGDVTKFATANPSDGGLSAEYREALQNASRFHEVHFTNDLPPAVVALCAGDSNTMANPGQKWNATDAISDPSLPAKRLIWAAVGGEYYVVHYERGGIAHTFHILVAKVTKDGAKAEPLWRAMGGPFKDYLAFVVALQAGKLDDRMDYER